MRKILFLMMCLCFCAPGYAEIVGDFDGDQKTTLKDVAILLAWFQLPPADKSNSTVLLERAKVIYSQVSNITRFPKEPNDSLSGGTVTVKDVVLMLAWFQVPEKSWDGVKFRANEIIKGDYSSLEYLPETPIGDSTVPVTITGIQVDPQ
ncbi:MAG: hypothetical protein PHD82_17225 [Candidatus Riflebacteria bacterium]|nr:hypothetical protein [Candidatus Riflebacteria bacterium]